MILGVYDVGPEVGSGAMGTVHLATDRRTKAVVALKRIHPKYASQKQTLRRFAVEVQAAGRLKHPNIVSVIASGTEARGTPYCVMEWVRGKPLTDWTLGQLKWRDIAWIMSDLLDALAYAHARGVVHRDLKPANILIQDPASEHPLLRLVDFGIARLLESEDQSADATALTMDDRVVGTPAYLSPEQAQGLSHLIGPHTDLYSTGVILYELIAGHLPFTGLPVVQLLLAHATKPAPPLDLSGRPDIPHQVASAVRWMLEKSADARPQSAHEVREALALPEQVARYPLVVGGEQVQPTPAGAPPTIFQATDPSVGQQAVQTVQGQRAREASEHPAEAEAAELQQYIPERVTLVGRREELIDLLNLARKIRSAGCTGLALVHGEAGIGKSRLVQELRYQLEESGIFRGARLLSRSGVSDDDPIRSLIARLLLAERLRGDALNERLRTVANIYYFSPIQVHALAAWLSDDLRNQAEAADRIDLAARVLRKIAIHKPLVLVFEGGDLVGSSFALRVLEKALLAEEQDSVIYAVVTSREPLDHLPPLLQNLHGRLSGEGRAVEVSIGPLSDDDLAELIRPFVSTYASEIAHSAKGSPLFALELARLRAGATLATTDQLLAVPSSLKEIWKTRVERTLHIAQNPGMARCALIAASLLGPSIRRRVLVSVVGEALGETPETVEAGIDIWTRTGVLMDDGRPDPTLSFVHMLAYEHVADSIDLKNPQISALLVHIADWVTLRRAGMDPDVLSLLANVLETGRDRARANEIRLLVGELRVGRLEYAGAQAELEKLLSSAKELKDQALEIKVIAQLANLAILRGDLELAEERLGQADVPSFNPIDPSEQTPLTPRQLAGVAWLQAQANLHLARGRPELASSVLEQTVALARASGDPLGLAHARTRYTHALELSGAMADAERQCRLAIRGLEQSEAPERLRAGAHIELARLCRKQGRIAEAMEAATQALPLAEKAGDRQQVDAALEVTLLMADDRGDTDTAIRLAERVLEQKTTFGDTVGIIRTENQLGVLERHRVHLEEAQEHHDNALKYLEKVPDPRMLAHTCENMGLLSRTRGSLDEALDLLQEASEMYQELSERSALSRVWCHLALVLRATGQSQKAERMAQQAHRTSLDLSDLTGVAGSQTALGLLAADRQNFSTARELFSDARTHFATMGIYRQLVQVETWLALCEFALSNHQVAHMAARDIADRLKDRPVYRHALAEGLERLATAVDPHDRDLAWRLQDRAREIQNRLSRTGP